MEGFRCPRLIHVTNGEQESPLQAAQRIAPRAAHLAVQIERERALPPELLEEMRDAGLFSLCLPRALGGGEVEPAEMVLALEALARGDGASAWCAMVASTCGLLGAYLPREQAELIFDGGNSIVGGVFAPRGRAERAEGGFLVSGRWSFVSGVGHSDWVLGGCLIASGEGVEMLPGGGPDVRLMLMPKADIQVIDTWSVAGLCGTGSHDMAVDRLLVPAGRSVSLFTDRPHLDGPLYAFPLFGLLALGICAVALGIARGAIDDLTDLASGKRPAPGARSLAERSTIQAEVARAEAALRAARALVLEEARNAWEPALAGEQLSDQHRLGLRLAATHATRTAADVAGAMYQAGGGSSIYDSSPLQRRFRDTNVATQHMMVAPSTWELTGRLLLSLPTDTSQL
jgi:alkylation response protein AidB-like acyl-CoA dehydrogenase